jgi:serine/threonine protein phosphatase 1
MPAGVRSILKRFMGHDDPATADAAMVNAATVPEGLVIYAVGDVHGRLDLLYPLLQKIALDAARLAPDMRPELIFLGDYVDRGANSRGVIELVLSAFKETDFWSVTALKGNHEATLLAFLDNPLVWADWAAFGAPETLTSYGVRPPASASGEDDWARASRELNARMPQAHKHFLSGLPVTAQRGDYLFVHAGVRPQVPLDAQTEDDLLWIRNEFLLSKKRLEKVIVHGHTPAEEAYIGDNRIGVDTGAYATNVLTAAKLSGAERTLIQVRGPHDTIFPRASTSSR